MTIKEKIEGATIEQAQEWQQDQEQFIFCIDYLEISAHAAYSDNWVWALENRFEKLLKQQPELPVTADKPREI